MIRNGHITGWGGNAIASYVPGFLVSSYLSRCILQDLVANNNGGGISGGASSSIFRCVSGNNKGVGISLGNTSGVCKDCLSDSNTGDGIDCAEGGTITHCSAQGNTGIGINCFNGLDTIIGCTVRANSGGGISATATLIRDCLIDQNTGYGVQTSYGNTIEGCDIGFTFGPGIVGVNLAGIGKSLISGNNIHDNTIGLSLTNNPGNLIYANTLRNTTNLNVGSGNSAPVSSDPTTAGPWYNLAF